MGVVLYREQTCCYGNVVILSLPFASQIPSTKPQSGALLSAMDAMCKRNRHHLNDLLRSIPT